MQERFRIVPPPLAPVGADAAAGRPAGAVGGGVVALDRISNGAIRGLDNGGRLGLPLIAKGQEARVFCKDIKALFSFPVKVSPCAGLIPTGAIILFPCLLPLKTAATVLTITSPTDQSHLSLSYDEYFDLSWTCDSSTTEVELWVDGRAYCSYCGSGYSGTMYNIDSWANPPFIDQCWHTLQLRAAVGLSWAYSKPITIYDTASPYKSCFGGPPCALSTMGGPVDVATGKMWYETEDLSIDGPLPLSFKRRYVHRRAGVNGPLGYGWTHTFLPRVWTSYGAAHLLNDEGREILFPSRYEGGWADNRRDHLSFASISGGYEVTTKDGTRYDFDSGGALTSITDRNGNSLTVAYDASSRVSTVTDSFGRVLTFTYDTSDRIISLTDGTRTVGYAYDAAGNLETFTDAAGKNWTYAYDSSHRLLSVTDPLSHVVEAFTYDGSDRVATFQKDSGNKALTFSYDSATQTSVTNSLGNSTVFTLDRYNGVATAVSGPGCSSCGTGSDEAYVRDAYFNKTQITDGNGNVTRQTFDDYGDVLTRTEAYGTSLQRTTTYTYEPAYHFLSTITVPSVDTSGHDRVETFTYDSNGNLLTDNLSGYSNGSSFSRTTTYTYNSHGLVLTEDGPRTDVSDVTTYTYYSDGDADPAKRGRLHTITDALGHVTTINAYTLSGKATVTIDQNNVERDDAYDNMDRLTGTTLKGAGPGGVDLTTSYTLNDAGFPTLVTLPEGNTLSYGYDTVNRLTSITDQAGNKTVYAYNTEGKKTREELQDPSATVTKFTNYAYDAYNRLKYVYYNSTVPPAAGSVYWEYAYDSAGNRVSTTDPQGHLVCYEYDALNRKTSAHQYLGTPPTACLGTCSAPDCTDLVTRYGYDSQDHITSVTDPGGLVTTYKADDAGKVIQKVSPDTGTATYTYDPAGNLSTKTDANGVTETRTYDALNRITCLCYPDSSSDVGYTYDSTEVTCGIGRRTGMSDPAGTSVFSYDAVGHLVKEERTPTGQANVFTQYSYDKNGNLTGITCPSGRQISFTVNTSNRVTAASADVNGTSTTIASSIAYEPFGPHTGITFGNGLVDTRTFDTRYRLETWTLGSLVSKTYTRQDDDDITGITDNLNAANNRAFGYDAIHRLTTANGPWGAGSYTYDANGNRLTKTLGASNTTYAYTAGTNRVATATGSEPGTYGYDNNGNITDDGTHTYQYSQRDRLATADSGTTASYSYDGDGRRVKKTVSGSTTLYFYDNEGKLLEEYVPATSEGKDYIWLPMTHEPLARVDFTLTDTDNGNVLRNTKSSPNVHLDWSLDGTSGPFLVERSTSFSFSNPEFLGPAQSEKTFDDGVLTDATNYSYRIFRRTLIDTLYFYHADHLGTSIAMTNGAGTLVWRAEHTPFGGIYALTVSTITNNLRFAGQYFDSETSLNQNYYREYDFKLGRYREPDPLGLVIPSCHSPIVLSIGLYAYVKSNPVSFLDPQGKMIYGCYCGAGQDLSSGHCPKDSLDQACKNHDECYEKAGLTASTPIKTKKQCIDRRKCDKALCQEAKQAKCHWWDQRCLIARGAIVDWACLRAKRKCECDKSLK